MPAPVEIGVIAHRIIARVAGEEIRPEPHQLTDHLLVAAVCELGAAGATPRRRAAIQKAASLASVYWRRFPPPLAWRLLAAERPVGDGRADLVFDTGDGIVIDEIKTSPDALGPTDDQTLDQARSYATGGRTAHGPHFRGVRVLTLANARRSIFIDPFGAVLPVEAGTEGVTA